MILEGRVMYGCAASQLRTLARAAVKELGLKPTPDMAKGCWLARNTFPLDTPYHLYRKALKEYVLVKQGVAEREAEHR
ncbi:MAG TPA: hypothetical protein DEQ28_03300 [Clostridiales bacterium]|nr:hypothetical protein [Clostridiales bacterium]